MWGKSSVSLYVSGAAHWVTEYQQSVKWHDSLSFSLSLFYSLSSPPSLSSLTKRSQTLMGDVVTQQNPLQEHLKTLFWIQIWYLEKICHYKSSGIITNISGLWGMQSGCSSLSGLIILCDTLNLICRSSPLCLPILSVSPAQFEAYLYRSAFNNRPLSPPK